MSLTKESKARVWKIFLIEFLKSRIIIPIILVFAYGYFVRGIQIWRGTVLDYITLFLLLIPLPTTFDKKGVHWIFFRNWKWSKFKYYKLDSRSVELYDKNKKSVHTVGFIYQSNLEPTLKKYCKRLK